MTRSKVQLPNPRARVLIIDDHPAICEALAIRIVGESDWKCAARLLTSPRPSSSPPTPIPMSPSPIELSLKSGSGLDLIKRLREKHDQLQMFVWSMYSEDLYAEHAFLAGDQGYINKEHAPGQIIEAIRQVLNGKVYLSPAMTEKLLERQVGSAKSGSGLAPINTLSDRELDVFQLIGQGVKTADMATCLHLSVKTVEPYRNRIRQKLKNQRRQRADPPRHPVGPRKFVSRCKVLLSGFPPTFCLPGPDCISRLIQLSSFHRG